MNRRIITSIAAAAGMAMERQRQPDEEPLNADAKPNLPADQRERPSQHGAYLGQALAALADMGRKHAPGLPEMCATCAFREGCMTNQMTATGLIALNCVLGIDPDRFACHHGMKDGDPTHICGGYIAAVLAPWGFTQEVVKLLSERLAGMGGPDEVRAAFDAWVAEVDPENTMNDYQRGRAWLRTRAQGAAALTEAPR